MTTHRRATDEDHNQGFSTMSFLGAEAQTPLRAYRIARTCALLVWDGREAPSGRRLRPTVNGVGVKPPISMLSVALDQGTVRNVLAIRIPPVTGLGAVRVEDLDGRVLACDDGLGRTADSRWTELDVDDLLAGLESSERMRICRFMLDVCPGLFHIHGDPVFHAGTRRLLAAAVGKPRAMAVRCRLPGDFVVCEAAPAPGFGRDIRAAVLAHNTLFKAPFAPIAVAGNPGRKPDRLLMVVPAAAKTEGGRTVIVFGDQAVRCFSLRQSPDTAPDAVHWLRAIAQSGGGAAARRYVLDCLAGIAADNDQAAALLRELQAVLPRPAYKLTEQTAAVSASVDLIVGSTAGAFVTGQISDPHNLVQGFRIERAGTSRSVPGAAVLRLRSGNGGATDNATGTGDRISGGTGRRFAFAATDAPAPVADAPLRIFLTLRSGRELPLAEGPALLSPFAARDAVLAALASSPLDPAAAAAHAASVVTALHGQALARRDAAEVVAIGAVKAKPKVSVIIPVGNDAALARCRAAMIANDPAMAGAELVHVLAGPDRQGEVETFLRTIFDAYGLPGRLVIVPEGCDGGAVLNAGVAASGSQDLVILHACAVPSARGWLPPLLDFRAKAWRGGIVGARLIHEDFSVWNDGVDVAVDGHGRRELAPRRAGFPRDFGRPWHARRVAALTPGCVVVNRHLLDRLGGFNEEYLGEETCIADICLGTAARGLGVSMLREPAVFRFPAETAASSSADATAIVAEIDRLRLESRWHGRTETDAAAAVSVVPAARTLRHDHAKAAAPRRAA